MHGGDLPGHPRRFGASGPGAHRDAQLREQLSISTGSITYPYADDVAPLLPAGTIIHIISWHDNTAPTSTTRSQHLGRQGPRTIDEMSFAWVSLTYLEQADFDQRVADRRNKSAKTSTPNQ